MHDTLHHTFAFINIHLDIHRIIIIITQAVASALKTRLQKKEKEAVLCFAVYEKKGRCFSPSAQKRSFVHSKADWMRLKETEYITRYVQIYISFFHNYITNISPEFFAGKSFTTTVKLQPVILQLHHPAHIKAE